MIDACHILHLHSPSLRKRLIISDFGPQKSQIDWFNGCSKNRERVRSKKLRDFALGRLFDRNFLCRVQSNLAVQDEYYTEIAKDGAVGSRQGRHLSYNSFIGGKNSSLSFSLNICVAYFLCHFTQNYLRSFRNRLFPLESTAHAPDMKKIDTPCGLRLPTASRESRDSTSRQGATTHRRRRRRRRSLLSPGQARQGSWRLGNSILDNVVIT